MTVSTLSEKPHIRPAIAVVMPAYNRAARIGKAIESVLAQDFSDFELIVVDDGSTDGTAVAVESYRDSRIRLLRQPENHGGNAARNRGIEAAVAPLISFLDSDDAFLPHKLGFVVRYFEANRNIDVLLDSFALIHPGQKRPDAKRVNPVLRSSAEIEQAIFTRRLYKATPAISLRKEAAINAGLFDETLKRRQDFDLILRLARTARCASTDEILWTKFWSADAISAKSNTFMAATIDLCRRHPQYLTDPVYRTGLARDTARHFARLALKGDFGGLGRDARHFAGEYGNSVLARLVLSGLFEMAKRAVSRAQ